ncbi:unnamed protein product [Symbiodinium sp. CCMP2592]|nr:unnamed protein product [Symbiodinium sp. CCMP2592]
MAFRRASSALWPTPCTRGPGYCIRPFLSPQLAPLARHGQGLGSWQELRLDFSRLYGGGAEAEKALQIQRKKMLYQARNRGDPLLADFLVGFVEAKGLELTLEDGESWAKLMECEEEFLMNLAAAKIEVPEDLNSSLLRRLQDFLAAGPPRKGLTGDSPWGQ